MTVDTFGFKLAYTSGLYGAPILTVSIDVRATREIEHQCVVYVGGLPTCSTVMRTIVLYNITNDPFYTKQLFEV